MRYPILTPLALAAAFAATWATASAQAEPSENASPWGDFLAGYHAESTSDTLKALEHYGAAARQGLGDSPDLNSRMYILGLTEGQLDNALAALDKAEAQGAKAPLANLARAVRALRDGDFVGAEVLLAEDTGGISRILGPVLSAWAKVGRKDFKGAAEALDKLIAGGGAEVSPLHLLHAALIHDLAGDAKQAGELFDQLQGKAGAAVRTAELIGQYFERAGRLDDARKLYDSLGQDAERQILLAGLEHRAKTGAAPARDVATARDGAAEALYGVASALLSQNAWESALALTRMAEQLRPGFPPATVVAAAALQQNQRYEEANAIFEAIPHNSPFSWLARINMADNLDRMEQTERAVRLLKAMAKEQPELSRPLIQLGDVLRRHERFREAADAYTEALERIGEPGEAHWVVFYSRGIAFEQTKRWPQAEADFLKALALSPDQPLVLNYLGYSWIDQGLNLEHALKMIEKAVEQRPRDGYIVDSLGWGLYRTGDYAGAVKHLERAAMLRPADPIINDHLGDALWRVGRVREARFQWERALAMEPEADLVKEIEKKLKSGLAAAKP